VINSPQNLKTQLHRVCGVDLTKIPGIKEQSAQIIISEVGLDMTKWNTEKQFCSFLGLCPSNCVSGGKVLRAEEVNLLTADTPLPYTRRQAAYDPSKLRGKRLVERIANTRAYRINTLGIRTLAALLILREKVIRPVLAGVCKPRPGRPPKIIHPLDLHYQNLQREMHRTLQDLALVA
jgi:transposase